MKSKHHIPLAILGIPFLFSNPIAHAQENHNDREKIAAEVLETSKERAKEARQKRQESAERARERGKEARENGQETAENAKERKQQASENAKERSEDARQIEQKSVENARERALETRKNGEEAAERARIRESGKENSENADGAAQSRQEAVDNAKDRAKDRTEDRAEDRAEDRVKEPREREKKSVENARESAEDRAEDAQERREDTSENAKDRLKEARENENETAKDRAKQRVKEARERETETAENANTRANDRAKKAAKREIVNTPANETERRAESKVAEITRDVQMDLEKRKSRIDGRDQAQALIKDILGADSRISRAEIAREERFKPRFERQRQGENRRIVATSNQRRAATNYYQERLHGRQVEGPAPEFFRRSDRRDDGRNSRTDGRDDRRMEYARPRYLNEGRRYVHYDSRSSIPAILMAAQVLNYVRFQPTREIAPIFYDRQNAATSYAMPLPPENYRSADSVVVSYPVDENSMISSEDILFLQGSTQFSDPYSYEVISIMADAMKTMPEDERFVIEGHASAEGSYQDNMILSQHRAEHIVREIVRRGGVSPDRLIPVGYGESEARHPADSAEALRSQDRRVVVFRMKPESITQR